MYQVCIVLTCLFLWEHIAQVKKWQNFRPTWLLVKLSMVLQKIFFYLGVLIARVCAIMIKMIDKIYTLLTKIFENICTLVSYLYLEQFYDTILYVLRIFYDLLTSFKFMKIGIEYVASLFPTYVTKRITITSSLLLLTVSVITIGYYFIDF